MDGLFFFHLAKAGGVSLRTALHRRFAPEECAPVIENDTVDHIRNAGNYQFARGFRFYAGHFGADIFRAVDDGHQVVTNFRHPVSRVGSLYRFFRSVPIPEKDLLHPRFFAVRFARARTFEEFVLTDDPRVRVYTENHHARQLTQSPWQLQAEIDLPAAVALIDRMPCFYVCEEPERSLAWFGEQFGLADIPRENVTPPQESSGDTAGMSDAILAINPFDLALYDYALARLRALRADCGPKRAAA